MSPDVRSLYKITGEEGPALKRVEAAMEWLLSPQAEGIGEKLLRDAYALHGKPLPIHVSQGMENEYNHILHELHINPSYIDGILFPDAHGILRPKSVESVLAHELTHAGEVRLHEGEHERKTAEAEITVAYNQRFTQAELEAQQMHLVNALRAADYPTAIKHIERYVDEVSIPTYKELIKQLPVHPRYRKFADEFEKPAVDMENKVAALRGEPIRTDYVTGHAIPPETLRQMIIEETAEALNINEKPRLISVVSAAHTGEWTRRVSGEGNAQEHPLIARHEGGAKKP